MILCSQSRKYKMCIIYQVLLLVLINNCVLDVTAQEEFDKRMIHVGSLSYGTTADTLKDFFSSIGKVVDAVVITDRETGRSRGFGFVTFEGPRDVENAIELTKGKEIDGREVRVSKVRSRKQQDSYGGGRDPRRRGQALNGGGGDAYASRHGW